MLSYRLDGEKEKIMKKMVKKGIINIEGNEYKVVVPAKNWSIQKNLFTKKLEKWTRPACTGDFHESRFDSNFEEKIEKWLIRHNFDFVVLEQKERKVETQMFLNKTRLSTLFPVTRNYSITTPSYGEIIVFNPHKINEEEMLQITKYVAQQRGTKNICHNEPERGSYAHINKENFNFGGRI